MDFIYNASSSSRKTESTLSYLSATAYCNTKLLEILTATALVTKKTKQGSNARWNSQRVANMLSLLQIH